MKQIRRSIKHPWLNWALIGIGIGVFVWVFMFVLFVTSLGSLSSLWDSMAEVSINFLEGNFYFILFLCFFVTLVMFGLSWIVIMQFYQNIKTEHKLNDYVFFGFSIGTFVVVFISIFNSLFGRIFSESMYLFIKTNRWKIYLIIFFVSCLIGLFCGLTQKIKK